MWGFYNSRNRVIAEDIFNSILNVNLARKFSPFKYKNKYNGDQIFLKQLVYPKIKRNSTIHDSFTCTFYGGDAFPTKRIGDCFVGNEFSFFYRKKPYP